VREVIKKIYQSIIDGDVEPYVDISLGFDSGDIELLLEDIVPLCQIFIHDYEFLEFSQTIEIPGMIYDIINGNDKEIGLRELIKGLEEIYRYGPRESVITLNYDYYLERFLEMFILGYEEKDMVLFGRLISESKFHDFKSEIVKRIDACINEEEDQDLEDLEDDLVDLEDLKIKGKVLMNNIVIE